MVDMEKLVVLQEQAAEVAQVADMVQAAVGALVIPLAVMPDRLALPEPATILLGELVAVPEL